MKIACSCGECERCRYETAPRVRCSVCGEPTGYLVGLVDQATHPKCKHGMQAAYASGCRCDECVQGRSERNAKEYQRKPRVPCAKCGGPTGYRLGKISSAFHRECRPIPDHGTRGRYRDHACRCQVCRDWRADDMRRFAERRGRFSISRADRRALYERDGWTCQLCFELVDRFAHHLDPWAPTLDHIIPRSVAVDDSASNLRTAHRWCNMILNDGRKYDVSFFAPPERLIA